MKKNLLPIRWLIFFAITVAIFIYYCGDILIHSDDQGDLLVHFISYSEPTDCILLKQTNKTILIDSGPASEVTHTIEELHANSVDSIDYLILTHPEEACYSGVAGLLQAYQITHVIEPNYSKEDSTWDMMNDSLKKSGAQIIVPTNVRTLYFGDMHILILPPNEKLYNNTNNYSLALLVNDNKIKMLFPGGAGKKRLAELQAVSFPKIDLYDVADNGRRWDNSADLIKQISPSYAVISAENADEEVADALSITGSIVVSSSNGDVSFISDGETLTLKEPNE